MESDLYDLDDLTTMSTLAKPIIIPIILLRRMNHRNKKQTYYNDNPVIIQKLVSNTLQNRFEKMQAEEMKLKQIKKALSLLDSDTSKEIHVFKIIYIYISRVMKV